MEGRHKGIHHPIRQGYVYGTHYLSIICLDVSCTSNWVCRYAVHVVVDLSHPHSRVVRGDPMTSYWNRVVAEMEKNAMLDPRGPHASTLL